MTIASSPNAELSGQQKPGKEVSYEIKVCGFCWYGPAHCWVLRVADLLEDTAFAMSPRLRHRHIGMGMGVS